MAVTMNLQHVFSNKLNQFATNVYNVSEAAHGDYIIHLHTQVDQEQAFSPLANELLDFSKGSFVFFIFGLTEAVLN